MDSNAEFMEFLRNKRIQILFFVLGATGGFLYWKFVGCNGACTIKSVWYWMTLWGAAVGYLIGDFVNDFLVRRMRKKEEENAR